MVLFRKESLEFSGVRVLPGAACLDFFALFCFSIFVVVLLRQLVAQVLGFFLQATISVARYFIGLTLYQ